MGKHYDSQTGYVPRNNYFRTEPNIYYTFYPHSQLINNIQWGIDADFFWRIGDGKALDWDFSPAFFRVNFQNSAQLRVTPYRWDYTYLYQNFDPVGLDTGQVLSSGTKYLYAGPRINFNSNTRSRFYYAIQTRFGQYFNGNIFSWTSSWSYRLQPFAIFSLDLNYTRIRLPVPYNRADLWVIGQKADISFSKSVFFTAYF